MRKGIHPEYRETTIVCACGNTVHTRSTKESIHVEICSKCHPFYTGKQKLVDSAGRVDRFQKRYEKRKMTKLMKTASTGNETPVKVKERHSAPPQATKSGGIDENEAKSTP